MMMMRQETKSSAALIPDGDRAAFGGQAEGRDEGRPGKIWTACGASNKWLGESVRDGRGGPANGAP